MDLQEILLGGSGALFIVLALIQISPLKINPWSAIGRVIGQTLNKDVMDELKTIKKAQAETRETLDDHIRMDDERNADLHRAYILRFNTELLRGIEHTEEGFNEILYNIDCYERYCEEHPKYQNNRAVHAIRHIKKVYDEHLENGTFLKV
ncbi:MAG: hypothetical protein J1D89_09390 [Agathobacter sp.]|nr:hypothetical protein [Agathobacter sp.]